MSDAENPFGMQNVEIAFQNNPEDVRASMLARGLPEHVADEVAAKQAEMLARNPFTSTDCDECHLMGAVGVQLGYNPTDDPSRPDYMVVGMCAPCTLRLTESVRDSVSEKVNDLGRFN